jgi:hypothetical protein
MDRPIPKSHKTEEEIMTQPDPQHLQALAAQPQRADASDSFFAAVRGMRSVALSLLVDRALSA